MDRKIHHIESLVLVTRMVILEKKNISNMPFSFVSGCYKIVVY